MKYPLTQDLITYILLNNLKGVKQAHNIESDYCLHSVTAFNYSMQTSLEYDARIPSVATIRNESVGSKAFKITADTWNDD